jgi:hypothetical protein
MSDKITPESISASMQSQQDHDHLLAVAMIASAGMAYVDFDPSTVRGLAPKETKRLFDFAQPVAF